MIIFWNIFTSGENLLVEIPGVLFLLLFHNKLIFCSRMNYRDIQPSNVADHLLIGLVKIFLEKWRQKDSTHENI